MSEQNWKWSEEWRDWYYFSMVANCYVFSRHPAIHRNGLPLVIYQSRKSDDDSQTHVNHPSRSVTPVSLRQGPTSNYQFLSQNVMRPTQPTLSNHQFLETYRNTSNVYGRYNYLGKELYNHKDTSVIPFNCTNSDVKPESEEAVVLTGVGKAEKDNLSVSAVPESEVADKVSDHFPKRDTGSLAPESAKAVTGLLSGSQQPGMPLIKTTRLVNTKSANDVSADQASDTASGLSDSHPYTESIIYTPLHSPWSIRLIRIEHPDLITGEVRCTLKQIESLTSGIPYDCLSYCWGARSDDKRIGLRVIDGACISRYLPFTVTANLHKALRSLWSSHPFRWLWIDAICIDQENALERGTQVSLMGHIYSYAESVIIWLGDSSERPSSAFATIRSLSELFTKDTAIQPDEIFNLDGLALEPKHLQLLESYSQEHVLGASAQGAYEDVASIFSLPWFRRVWVLQEVFAGPPVVVRFGHYSTPFGSLILAALWQSSLTRSYIATHVTEFSQQHSPGNSRYRNDVFSLDTLLHPAPRGFLPELWLGLLHARKPRGLSILDLVCRGREFLATDPRDKVFALLGLANDINTCTYLPRGLLPDYTKTKIEVYCDFAKSLVAHQRSLDILSAIDTFTPQDPSKLQQSPSWMPALDVSIATIRGFGYPRKYNASASSQALVFTQAAPEILTLSGFRIDAIRSTIRDILQLQENLQIYLGNQKSGILTVWDEHVKLLASEYSDDSLLTAYINTVTAAGFATKDNFSEYPLGKIVPSRQVPSIHADFAAYWARMEPSFLSFDQPKREELLLLSQVGDALQFGVLAGKACHERLFFFTSDGHIGLYPQASQDGDLIVIFYGGSVPYVVRKRNDGCYTFIGECYVNGIMFGEAVQKQKSEGIKEELFILR